MSEGELSVGGLTPLTTVDYPDRLSAVIFCQGCPMRCRYCHNPALLPRLSETLTPWSEILGFLQSRRGLLDAVVFSGGEPTQQLALAHAIRQVKAMGFEIGLHTAGVYPKRLAQLLPLLDWVGLDIKALPESYPRLTGMRGSGELAWQSAELLIASGIPHQIRTTFHPALMSQKEKSQLQKRLDPLKPQAHQWQVCRTEGCLDARLDSAQPAAAALSAASSIAN
jgi:pyruvate formate lyase activating enzyme